VKGLDEQGNRYGWDAFFKAVNPNLQHVIADVGIDNASLLTLIRRCPQLKSLMARFRMIDGAILKETIQKCPRLSTIDLQYSIYLRPEDYLSAFRSGRRWTEIRAQSIPDAVFARIPALRRLALHLSPRSLPQIALHCKQLTELTIEPAFGMGDQSITSEDVRIVAEGCPLLTVLRINAGANDAILTALGEHCRNLRDLSMVFWRGGVTDSGVAAQAHGCPQLRHIADILVQPVSMVGVTALATHCTHLRVLQVFNGVVSRFGTNVPDQITILRKLKVVSRMLPAPK
jgi:hypothetical protein